MARSFRHACFVLLSLLLVGCDHATKGAASVFLAELPPVKVVPGVFDLRYTENHNAAFSMLRGWSHPDKAIFLSLLASAMVLFVASLWWRRRAAPLVEQAGYALVVGGAVGNIIDRIARGYVIDFLHISRWPVFNVADVAIGVGAALLALSARSAWSGGPPAPEDAKTPPGGACPG